jgi:hypothetical protein
MMYPTQLAAEALAADAGHQWDELSPEYRRLYLNRAEYVCKAIVTGEEGWQIVRVADSWAGENGGHCILADEVWAP